MTEKKFVVAMYDVRGIQNYIFKTAKMRDAIGASAIVENIIEESLIEAAKAVKMKEPNLKTGFEWRNEKGPLKYIDNDTKDIKVVYIGGGNAYVIYSSKPLALRVSKMMARYTIDATYSLQLATAIVEKTGDYKKDFDNLRKEMERVKESMAAFKPMGALPIMQIEKKTGYAITEKRFDKKKEIKISTETDKKTDAAINKRRIEGQGSSYKKLESYIKEKGESSMLAVVHIDGNSMGLRIRRLTENVTDYNEGVNLMRRVSFNIDHSYKQVFEDMEVDFNNFVSVNGKTEYFVMKVITAGDDITYVCNANIAFATVEYFCKNISSKSMIGDGDTDEYRFSACGGIAFFRSHFPFNIAYNVAEACCGSAKNRGKRPENMSGRMTGNWVDFQFCQNIQSMDLEKTRMNEYMTRTRENLLLRPYIIYSGKEMGPGFRSIARKEYSFERLKKNISALNKKSDTKYVIPRSFVKALRNSYAIGEHEVNELLVFLRSRSIELPDEVYCDIDGERCALLYDAVELADYFTTLEECRGEVE